MVIGHMNLEVQNFSLQKFVLRVKINRSIVIDCLVLLKFGPWILGFGSWNLGIGEEEEKRRRREKSIAVQDY